MAGVGGPEDMGRNATEAGKQKAHFWSSLQGHGFHAVVGNCEFDPEWSSVLAAK